MFSMKGTLPDFRGKTVSFSTTESILVVENPQFREKAGRVFVVGTIPRGATASDWALGIQCGVAWSAVTDYMVFDSVEDYRRRLVKSRRKR